MNSRYPLGKLIVYPVETGNALREKGNENGCSLNLRPVQQFKIQRNGFFYLFYKDKFVRSM